MNKFLLVLFLMQGVALASATALGDSNTQKLKCVWKQVWSDEFSDLGAVDSAKWKYQVGGDGWGNNEFQNYTARTDNARVENGRLIVEAKKENLEDNEYTSARLNSVQSWTYAKFEFRAKVPGGRGVWPAVWLLADEQTYGQSFWPDNGEIDILEQVGHTPNMNFSSIHTLAYNFKINTQKSGEMFIKDLYSDYHTYVLDWRPDRIDSYVDGKKYLTFKKPPGYSRDLWRKWPFDKPFHLIINLAVGGDWGAQQGIDDEAFPAKMLIDYVRVYQATDYNCR